MKLTDRQKQYLWIMGSFPDKIAVQGRGYRTPKLQYGIDREQVVLFGYSDPFLWLERLGLVRKLQNANAYVLTDEGDAQFASLLLNGAGLSINRAIREVKVAPANPSPPLLS